VGSLQPGEHRSAEPSGPLFTGSVQQTDSQRTKSTFPRSLDHLRRIVVAVIYEKHHGARLNGVREPPEQRLHIFGLVPRWH
jgi:hypothetical protein